MALLLFSPLFPSVGFFHFVECGAGSFNFAERSVQFLHFVECGVVSFNFEERGVQFLHFVECGVGCEEV